MALLLAGGAATAGVMKLDLESSLQLARQRSRPLLDRRSEVAAAGHRVAASRARFLPQLKVSARYLRLSYVPPGQIELPIQLPNQPPLEPVTLGESIRNQYSLRFTVEQPLFTGFALLRGNDAAHAGEALARARLEQESADLEVAVEDAYLGVWQAQELLQVARDSVRVLEAHQQSTSNLRAQGQLTRWEQDRVAARVAGARAQQLQAESALRLSQLALLNLLGLPDDQQLELTDVLTGAQPDAPGEAEALVAQALLGRPELAIAKASAEVRHAQARAAYAPMWPQVRLAASYGWDRPSQRYFPPEDVTRATWDAGVMLQWTLDLGATWHQAEAASLEAAVADRAVQDLEEKVRLDVERRYFEVRTIDTRVEAARLAVSAAEASLTRAQSLYAAGGASPNAVLDAELELTRARADRTQALANARMAVVRLRRATGGRHP